MANGQETGIETLRAVIARQARRNDWNSVRDFHQGQRSATAIKGRIHDRTPTRLPKHQKALAERGPSIHDWGKVTACRLAAFPALITESTGGTHGDDRLHWPRQHGSADGAEPHQGRAHGPDRKSVV